MAAPPPAKISDITPIAEDQNWKISVAKEEAIRLKWPARYGHMPDKYAELQASQKELFATKTDYGYGAHPKMTEYGVNFGADDNVRVDVAAMAATAAATNTSNKAAMSLTTSGTYGSLQPIESFAMGRVTRPKRDVEKSFGWPAGCI
eukprot:gene2311-7018_t